jgi:hypothetical protein
MFVFSAASRSVLGPTQPPIPGLFLLGVKLTTHLYLVLRSKTVELYLHSPTRLNDVVLNYLNSGTILPFFLIFYPMN